MRTKTVRNPEHPHNRMKKAGQERRDLLRGMSNDQLVMWIHEHVPEEVRETCLLLPRSRRIDWIVDATERAWADDYSKRMAERAAMEAAAKEQEAERTEKKLKLKEAEAERERARKEAFDVQYALACKRAETTATMFRITLALAAILVAILIILAVL